jgi:quinol monooxygenase YgiN
MIFIFYQLDVMAETRTEFIQSLPYILTAVDQQPGCKRNYLCQDIVNENRFFVFQEWSSQAKLDLYHNSKQFHLFRGMFHLLEKPPHLQHYMVSTIIKDCAM